jgi:hypothetical protein
VEALLASERTIRLAGVQKAAGYFRIARTMRRAYDLERGLERLAPALETLEHPRFRRVSADNLLSIIARLRTQLGEAYGNRDLLSAATKLLWLIHPEHVLIFDSQARIALGTPIGDYGAFVGSWRFAFQKDEPAIGSACAELVGMHQHLLCAPTVSPRQLKDLSNESWFKMRVFDIYLWHVGGLKQRWQPAVS